MRNMLLLLILTLQIVSVAQGRAFAQIATPLEIPNLVFWVDAQNVNGNGNQPNDGDVITSWTDLSGNGNNTATVNGTVTFQAFGFDGINPALRFPLTAQMAGPNPFGGTFQNEMTLFFVNANNTLTNNFSFNLNGTQVSSNIADGRFSFHTPFASNNIVFFDGGACCDVTRLQTPFPNAVTETTLYVGLNDEPGNRQLLRIDGIQLDSDSTGHNANVSGGIHIGDRNATVSPFSPYDGRFAEIAVYDRALTPAEVDDVECFLLLKWKLPSAPPGCAVRVSAAKTVEIFDPTGTGGFSIPGADVIYTITVTHQSGPAVDAGATFVVDRLPSEVVFFNGDIDDAGPETGVVAFSTDMNGLSFVPATDLAFSDQLTKPASLSDCNYAPLAGYDPAVTYICFQPSGALLSDGIDRFFSVSFRARIR